MKSLTVEQTSYLPHLTIFKYGNGPKHSDWQVWANTIDPDQTVPEEGVWLGSIWSGSTLFAILSAFLEGLFSGKTTLLKF